MKTTTKIIQTLTAVSASLILSTGLAAAHGSHDHSKLPLKWKFSKKVESKIQKRGGLQDSGYYIGLTSHKQKVLEKYGIKDGNIFSTEINGVNAYVKRTSAGIQIVDSGITNIDAKMVLPIRPKNGISLVSTAAMNHPGHDHSVVNYEWSFAPDTQNRIAKRLGNQAAVYVGLTHFEQALLNDYNIKVGNKFHTVIHGDTMIAERTSGGLKVMTEPSEVAQLNADNGAM